ncbi:MAG: autotransporter outer membrane beta-barrel domain-containing protein [Candidatus Adiutrix intracellularis]|jgi:hypothetical protein|nr:autotransporter outer membrane beta-barrel domain-containing protein [Candidatus Adiutrix intracellularis]
MIGEIEARREKKPGDQVLIALICFFSFTAISGLAQAQAPLDVLQAQAQLRLPTQALLNQGAELTYGSAFQSPVGSGGGNQILAFGGLVGARNKYDVVGEIDVRGVLFLTGLGRRFTVDDSPIDRFTLGLFVEGGSGSYDINVSPVTLGEIQSSGNSRYVGGGFLTRTEFHNGAFMEISCRTGQAKTEINVSPVVPSALFWSNPYFGAVGGVGYLLDLSEMINLNLYTRMLWSHQKSQVVGAVFQFDELNSIFQFDELNSTRTHLGGRFNFEATDCLKIYTGAVWEHEFNGRQDFKLEGIYAVNPPDFGGDSLLSEAGLIFRSAPDSGFSAQVGVGASLGVRQSLTGGLRLRYEFF